MKLRNFLCLLLLFATVVVFASCGSGKKTKSFTVTFNSNGGSEVAAATVKSGEKATAPADPTQAGYAFEGWYLSSKKWNFEEDAIVTNITLTAKWTKLYTVTIDPANGTEPTVLTLKEGETITKPEDPTATGKNFLGWYSETAKWNFADPVEADVKLTAKWETVYTVTFDTDGAGTIDPQVVVAGSKATAPADPTKAEYIFEGWYNGDKQWIFTENAVNANITLKAKWRSTYVPPETFTVTIDVDGGTFSDDTVTSFEVEEGTLLTKPADPTREGYQFDGWFDGALLWNFQEKRVTKNVTLKAAWTKLHTVSFDTDGAGEITSQIVRNNENATEPTTPTKTGYKFIGWYVGDVEFDFEAGVTSDVTIKAVWKEFKTVTFDVDGGNEEIPAEEVFVGECATVPETPTKANSLFDGWYTEDGELWNFETPITADITLKAKWIAGVNVTFDVGDADCDPIPSQSFVQGETAEKPADPKWYGYDFKGWYTESGELWNFENAVNSDLKLIAKWEVNKEFGGSIGEDGTIVTPGVPFG